MPKLAVRLLGGFNVELDGRAVYGFDSDKGRALLAYLVVEGDRPHRREALASLLWPDRPDSIARKNLRQALFRLRQTLLDYEPPFFIFATPTDLQFNTAGDYTLDVTSLQVFNAAASHPQLLPETLCGDFLAGFSVPDSETFQAWVLNRQEHYHRVALEILDAQNAAFEAMGDFERAVAAARLQLQIEPWLEEAHRRCMRGLALAGRRDEALHQYELCKRALEAELGAQPAESTSALVARIREGRLVVGQMRSVTRRGGVTPPLPAVSAPSRNGMAPGRLVAREDELGQLTRHLYAALAGEPRVVFVSGDAGSGKTALLETFAESAMAEHPDLLAAGACCSPGGSCDPFGPLRKLAEMLFGDLANPTAWRLHGSEQAQRLQAATDLALACLAEHGPDLTGTLVPSSSLAHRGGRSAGVAGHGPLLSNPATLFDQLTGTLAAISREQPLLLLFDDLHWVDEASAAFLAHLGRELSGSRLLVLGAYRSSTVSLGRRDAHTGQVIRHPLAAVVNELRRVKGDIVVELDRADGRAFVEAYVDTEPNRLGAPFRDALYAQTGGHALFTVETLRNLQERGELFKDEAGRWVAHESLDWGELPARVEATIAERIERLPQRERRMLSAASVQGGDFTGELVAELTGEPLDKVIAALSGTLARQHALVKAEGVVRFAGQQRSPAEAPGSAVPRTRSVYRFRHHLFQKYLYDELDAIERGRWHAAVASNLEQLVGEDPPERERFAARLAWHYESAGLPVEAARALLDAGRQATRVSAFREALNLLDRGLALLHSANAMQSAGNTAAAHIPEEWARAKHGEIEQLLQIARLVPMRRLSGPGAPGSGGAVAELIEAGMSNVQDRAKLATLSFEAEFLITRGQFEEVLAVAQRMLGLARQCGEDAYEALAHWWFGFTYHFLGEPLKADNYFEWILDRYKPGRWGELRGLIGFDLLPHSLAISAINKLSLGSLDQALARSASAVSTAQELGDQYGLAFVTAVGSMTLFLLGSNPQALQERAELCCRHCEKQGFAWWQYYAAAFLGWLTVMRGDSDEGIDYMRRAMAAWQATGMLLGSDTLDVVLADATLEVVRQRQAGKDPFGAAGRAGLLTEALVAVDAALAPGSLCGQCYQAELHRMRGELLLACDGLGAAGEALACFERALARGREKGALLWELRAGMSIVRLQQRQGEAYAAELAEARGRLAGVYARFTEGFTYPDLQEAASLLTGYPPC